ncbi:hypothetical protein N356_gp061 [Cellulophaga phage phi14:2]|uniref:Uncharacterized protein n=1 Tax=Cellulophaga phage phi14:2 TaxID=1327990 RepID=S0A3Z7_9CAUD|nr:hypothetical protein N356_gp061 [Cellulophaga phage phi14:2]AGO48953.1 hypothetical protein Phi14:2_gp075 [Cellulophaga phage phi14:2]
MKYYILKTETLYYDGHGEGEDGGITLEVVSETEIREDFGNDTIAANTMLEIINKSNGQPIILDHEDELVLLEDYDDSEDYPEDGYNYTNEIFTYSEIEENEYKKYSKIIKEYNDLLKRY